MKTRVELAAMGFERKPVGASKFQRRRPVDVAKAATVEGSAVMMVSFPITIGAGHWIWLPTGFVQAVERPPTVVGVRVVSAALTPFCAGPDRYCGQSVADAPTGTARAIAAATLSARMVRARGIPSPLLPGSRPYG
jgi:hypothetical protein